MKYYQDIISKMLELFFKEEPVAPFLKKNAVELRFAEVQNQLNKANATASFMLFVEEIHAVIDLLLTVNNSEFQMKRPDGPAKTQQSAKAIIKTLNGSELEARSGKKIQVRANKYIDIADFKNADSQKLLELLSISHDFGMLSNLLNSPHDPLNKIIVRINRSETDIIKKDKDQTVEILEKYLEVFQRFDKDLKKLYKCTSSLIFSKSFSCISAPNQQMATGFYAVYHQLKTSFSRKPAVFLLGNYANQKAIHLQLQAVYLNSLAQLRSFSLTFDENEKTKLAPAVFSEKQKIMAAFNRDYQALLKSLKPLHHESTFSTSIKADSKVHKHDPIFTATSVENSAKQVSPVVILARDATSAEYPPCDTLAISLVYDNDFLLTESELTYKIVEIQSFIMATADAFASTPNHLLAQPLEALKPDVEIYIAKLQEQANKVKTEYETFIGTLQNDIHKFSESTALLEIAKRLDQQILPSLSTIKSAINDENPTAETLLALRRKLTAIDALINDITKILASFISLLPVEADSMKLLTNSYVSIKADVASMQPKLSQLTQQLEQLKPQFTDRKKQSLIEIEALIQDASACKAIVEKGLSEITTPLNFNIKDQLLLALNGFHKQVEKFSQCVDQVNSKMATQATLLNNADLTRQASRYGQNPNLLLNTRSTTLQPSTQSSQPEEKTMRP